MTPRPPPLPLREPEPPPIQNYRPAARPKSVGRSSVLFFSIVVSALAVLAVCGVSFVLLRTQPVFESSEQRAVRAWLNENLSSFTLVKWSSAIDTSDLVLCQQRRNVDPFIIYDCHPLKSGKYIEVKYRAKTAFGESVSSEGFLVQNGKVISTITPQDVRFKSESESEWWNRTRPSAIAQTVSPSEQQKAEQEQIFKALKDIADRPAARGRAGTMPRNNASGK